MKHALEGVVWLRVDSVTTLFVGRGTPVAIIELKAHSIQEILAHVIDIASKFPKNELLWFRGIKSSDFKLLPTIMRDNKSTEEIVNREKRLITRFKQRGMAYWKDISLQDSWGIIFAMQHHGMPTRLLDWTENLFVSIYFAIQSPRSNEKVGNPVIWCLNPIRWNMSTPALTEYEGAVQILSTSDEEAQNYEPMTNKRKSKTPVAIYGTHNTNRILAQRGTFFIWGSETKPLEDYVDTMGIDIWRIEINADRTDLQGQLKNIGFMETTVFPELDSLARELTEQEGW